MSTIITKLNTDNTAYNYLQSNQNLPSSGSVAPQVNAGVLAFVSAFLSPERVAEITDPSINPSTASEAGADVEELRRVFAEFLSACCLALDVHKKRVVEAQEEYHASLVQRFAQMRVAADTILEGANGSGSAVTGGSSGGSGVVANLAPIADQDCLDQMLGPDSTA